MTFATLSQDARLVGGYALTGAVDIFEFQLPHESGGSSPADAHPFGQAPADWNGAILRGILSAASGDQAQLIRWPGYADLDLFGHLAPWRPDDFEHVAFADDGYELAEVDRTLLAEAAETYDCGDINMRLPEAIHFSSGLLFCLPIYAGAGYLSATYDLAGDLKKFEGLDYSQVLPCRRAYTECYFW